MLDESAELAVRSEYKLSRYCNFTDLQFLLRFVIISLVGSGEDMFCSTVSNFVNHSWIVFSCFLLILDRCFTRAKIPFYRSQFLSYDIIVRSWCQCCFWWLYGLTMRFTCVGLKWLICQISFGIEHTRPFYWRAFTTINWWQTSNLLKQCTSSS